MAVSHRLQEGVEHPRLHPVVGVGENAHLPGDLIRHLKSHARNVVGQAIGIFLQNAVELGAVLLVNFYSEIEGNAVVLQEHHGLAHVLFLLHLLGDGHGHLLADALDLGEALRLLLHNPEGVGFEMADNPGSQSGPDAFYGTGA